MLTYSEFRIPLTQPKSRPLNIGLNYLQIERGNQNDLRTCFLGSAVNGPSPDWMVFLDRNVQLPRGGERWCYLDGIELDQLEKNITCGLRSILEEKLNCSPSKFGDQELEVGFISARFDKDRRIIIFDNSTGRNISHHFHAKGERVVLYLAINKSLRLLDPPELRPPFIVGITLDWLDSTLSTLVMTFVESMSHQVVIVTEIR